MTQGDMEPADGNAPPGNEWAGDLGRRWADQADVQDQLLGLFQPAGFSALGPVDGRRVLDLGCGPGQSSLALADLGAEVTGLDISPDLIEVASRRRASRSDANRLEFVLADASTHRFERPFDALFSRFGAMFFDDPVPAWRNLRAAVKPGGRFVAVAWRSVKDNPWMFVTMRALDDLLPPVERPAPGEPGPFGWADPEVFAPWLREAGWRDVSWTPADVETELGLGDATDPAVRGADHMTTVGPLTRRIAALDEEARLAIRDRLAERYAGHVRDGAVRLGAGAWVVTATA